MFCPNQEGQQLFSEKIFKEPEPLKKRIEYLSKLKQEEPKPISYQLIETTKFLKEDYVLVDRDLNAAINISHCCFNILNNLPQRP